MQYMHTVYVYVADKGQPVYCYVYRSLYSNIFSYLPSYTLLASEVEKELRLVGGSHMGEGRLEIFYANHWGTICDHHFTAHDAEVACRQLGFPGLLQVYSSAAFGEGEGVIWVHSPNCTGKEVRLADCSGVQFGLAHSCQHTNDVSIHCGEAVGGVRLVNGSSKYEGRVEIYYAGIWGTVCNDGFDIFAATVVCRQSGFLRAVKVIQLFEVVKGSGTIWLDEVYCSGEETSLANCSHASWGDNDCSHGEDVGVVCSGKCAQIHHEDVC